MAENTDPGAASSADVDPYPIKVRGPDGILHPFPSGTTAEQIDAAMSSRYAPRGLPEAGAATPQAGAVQPFNQSVPSYTTPEDWQNIMAATILGKNNRGVVTAIQGTPGHQYRTELAKKTADEVAREGDAQRAGSWILKSYAQLLDRFNNTPDQALKGAIGPANLKPYKEWLPFIGGMTQPEAAASYALMPNFSGGNSEAWNTQNLLQHDAKGVTNAFIAAGKGMNMSDERQRLFASAMEDFLHSTNRQAAAEILEHAKHIISNDFRIPMATANSIVNQYLKDTAKEKQTAAAQPHRETMINKQTGQRETLEWNGKTWARVQ